MRASVRILIDHGHFERCDAANSLGDRSELRERRAMDTNRIFFEAIARRQRVGATYNRGRVILEPHILYTRHDEVYVDAITVERDGAPPREPKLGSFKLAGLGDPVLVEASFEPHMLFDPSETRYAGVTLFKVER
jgi:hypothetical protein